MVNGFQRDRKEREKTQQAMEARLNEQIRMWKEQK
jgi:hypothetical protein